MSHRHNLFFLYVAKTSSQSLKPIPTSTYTVILVRTEVLSRPLQVQKIVGLGMSTSLIAKLDEIYFRLTKTLSYLRHLHALGGCARVTLFMSKFLTPISCNHEFDEYDVHAIVQD